MIEVVVELSSENIREMQRHLAAPSEHARPCHLRNPVIVTEEGSDLEGFVLSVVDCCLVQVYDDHVHQNNGCHICGGISDEDV